MYGLLIQRPLRYLLLNGPRLNIFGTSIGFLGGVSDHNACEDMTGVSSMHWQIHDDVCAKLINSKIDRFVISTALLFYFYVLFQFIAQTLSWVFAQTKAKFVRGFLTLQGWNYPVDEESLQMPRKIKA